MLIRKNAKVEKIEGKHLVMRLDFGDSLKLLNSDFPEAKEGDIFVIQIQPEREANLEKDELARTLLNQLLHDTSDT